MKWLRAADYVRTPWKNGGGSTQEICRDQGEGLAGFGWRLSIADIGEAGPFSVFAGYERIITVLEGEGMRLQVDGHPSGALRAFEPFAFSGDSEVACELINGPIRDFNLIYAPARYHAQLQWLAEPLRCEATSSTRIVFAARDGVRAEVNGNTVTLGQYDTLVLQNDALSLQGHCCLIELSQRS